MIVYNITGNRIRVRPATGDQFEFLILGDSELPVLRLARPPRWAAGDRPANAEFRVYLAHAAARAIAQDAGLFEPC